VDDVSAVRGTPLIGDYPNLVVLRTFSKAYGLAGLRVGYAIGAEYVMDAARSVAIPLSVTEPAQRAAIASLQHESELLDRVARLNRVRDQIWRGLVAQGWEIPQPHGNFVWLPTGAETTEAAEVFSRNGIVTRPLVEGLRVSVGEAESVEKLLRASAEVVSMRRTGSLTAALD
jgi:histidinol-phosphate aminotransferase